MTAMHPFFVLLAVLAATPTLLAQDPRPDEPKPPGSTPTLRPPTDWGLGDGFLDKLLPFPKVGPGDLTPLDPWRYGGKDPAEVQTVPPWEEWLQLHREQKSQRMTEVRGRMHLRFVFSGDPIEGACMSGGKPVMKGPVARLGPGVASFEELAAMPAATIEAAELFPYEPLAHPLASTGDAVFPPAWVESHAALARIDIDCDLPQAYLPELPPPLFLTTHPEAGDVARGREVTAANYRELFVGLLTSEQEAGLAALLEPNPSPWFNDTTHRVTDEPSAGLACFSCHANGHTNAAFTTRPDTRPAMARQRLDTPSLRAVYNRQALTTRGPARSVDALVGSAAHYGVSQERARSIATMLAILDRPPAPKLGAAGTLLPELATAAELRGEALFYGRAQCVQCHSGPTLSDDRMHDLRVERFYRGRPEGPVRTAPLRGIKDSPPYLHDGRAPTLHDAVEFFNLVLELRLTRQEKGDLVAFLLAL